MTVLRALWVVDVEHRVVLFSRRFPNVERLYLSHIGGVRASSSAGEDSTSREASPRRSSTSSANPLPSADARGGASAVSGEQDVLTSILGVADTLLMESLLGYISGSGGPASFAAGGVSLNATSVSSSPGLARMKHGPFVPPIPIAECGDGATVPDATVPRCRGVVGPWVVCQSTRGVLAVVSPPGAASPAESGKASRRPNNASPTLSTSSLPSMSAAHSNAMPQLVVLESPDDVVVAESHPRYAAKQNLLIVALPLCRTAAGNTSSSFDDQAYLTDATVLAAWEILQSSIRPFVDHCLLVAPPMPPRSHAGASGPPLVLQPHGMIVVPAGGGPSKSSADELMQDAPPSWVDPKQGARQVHVVGGWSCKNSLRRVMAVYHWAQALHTLVATALPFGAPTLWLPQHTVTALGVGTALQVRAEQRVDASLKSVTNASMEPEALFQSVESGDRKMRGSEMLFVDTLHASRGSTPPSSSSDSHNLYVSSRSDDLTSGAASRQRRVVLSRAMKLIKDFDSRAAKQLQSTPTAAAQGRGKKAWVPTLPNAACVGVYMVYEQSAQLFGQGYTPGGAPLPLTTAADAYHACYRVQVLPPQSPNMHWLQRVEELAEAVEEGVAAVLLEDVVSLPIVVPSWWRTAPAAPPGSPADACCGLRVAVDESLVSAVDMYAEQPVHPIPPLKGVNPSPSNAASSKRGKSVAASHTLDDPIHVLNTSLELQSRPRTGSSAKPLAPTNDVLVVTANGLHVWAYHRTCGLVRPEEALHAPIDVAVLTPPASKARHHIVTGLYSLTPVATPAAVHTALSRYFGYDEAGMTADLDVLTPADRVEAQRIAKPNPSDEDLEHRAWLEGLLETPGHVLYHLDLELTLPVSSSAASDSAASSPLSFVEVLTFNAIFRFLDDATIVSLHLLHSHVYDEHGVPLHGGSTASSSGNPPQSTMAGAAASGGSASGAAQLKQIASDMMVWHSAAGGTILRCGSKLRLKAFLVLDLRSRSGAHELQSTLATTHTHMHAGEWQQLTTVISSAQLDFVMRTVDPMLCGGVQLLDSGVTSAAFPALAKTLELRASVLQSDLGSLHDTVHVGSQDEAVYVLRDALSCGDSSGCVEFVHAPPVVAPTIVCSGHASSGGYVLWNFTPAGNDCVAPA